MEFTRWIIGILLGALIGTLVSLSQLFFFDSNKYVASVTLYERVLFDEFWEVAPNALLKSELRRAELSSQNAAEKSERDLIVAELLNGWFRLLDETLFRFPIDEALKSSLITRDTQRYARINRGYADGLNQRSISFQVSGDDGSVVTRELNHWVANVQKASAQQAQSAVKSWFFRKAVSLRSISEEGDGLLSEDSKFEMKQMATAFQNAADNFPLIEPFTKKLSEVEVYSHRQKWVVRTAIWTLMGGLVGLFFMVAVRGKRTK